MKKFLQSPNFLLIVIFLSLLNNVDHAAYIYLKISRENFESEILNQVWAAFVVIVIELSIITFVIHDRKIEAGIYALSIFGINILYYDGLKFIDHLWICRSSATLFSLMFAYSIYVFSDLYFKVQNESSPIDHLEVTRLQNLLDEANRKLSRKKEKETI